MGAGLHNLPVIDDKDPVRIHNGGKPVGNDEAGPAAHQLIHRLLDQDLGAGIHVGGRLIQNEQPPVGQQRAEIIASRNGRQPRQSSRNRRTAESVRASRPTPSDGQYP